MATTVDTLLVRIEADMSDLQRSLRKVQKDVDKSQRGISGAFKKIGTAMKVAVAGVLVQQAIRGGAAMINLASDVEEMQGKSKVVFGQFRDQVVSDLDEFGNAVGRSTFELEGMASSIQDTFVPMGFARGEASKLSVELTKLAVDVASFNNASDTETMEAFQSALVGNHETVRRFGVVITEATLNQELLTMGIEGGAKAASNAEKVQARLNLITKGTSDAAGDAARTSGSFANEMRGLFAELKELAVGLTERLLPAVTKVVSAMSDGAAAAKRFLQEMGVIKMPITDELVFLGANINEIEGKLGTLKTNLQAALENPDPNAGYSIDGMELAISQLTEELDNLSKRRDELAEQVVMNTPVPAADMGFKPKEKTQAEKDALKLIDEQRAKLEELTAANRNEELAQGKLARGIRTKNKEEEIAARHMIALMDLKRKFPALTSTELDAEATLIAMREYANRVGTENISISEKRRDELASTADEMKNIADPLRELKKLEEEYNAALSAGLVSTEQHAAATSKLKEEMQKMREEILELNPLYKQLTDRANQAFDAMADSLTDMVMRGKFDLKSLGDMFKQTVREMIADAIKARIIKPMLSSAFGFLGSSIGNNPVGDFISSIGKSADGGNLNAGVPQIVGERGPELIIPKSASTIMNNHNTKNALGSGGGTIIQQTINVSAGVSQTVRAEMLSLLPKFKQDTMSAVVDAKRRGGSFGQAFG
jgi:hypothetical protein